MRAMSNIETVRRFYSGAAAGDLDAIRSILAPRLIWSQTPGFPNAQTFHTPDEVMEGVFGTLGDEWTGFKGVPHEFIDGGDAIVQMREYTGTALVHAAWK